jgi:hypothetical protein
MWVYRLLGKVLSCPQQGYPQFGGSVGATEAGPKGRTNLLAGESLGFHLFEQFSNDFILPFRYFFKANSPMLNPIKVNMT